MISIPISIDEYAHYDDFCDYIYDCCGSSNIKLLVVDHKIMVDQGLFLNSNIESFFGGFNYKIIVFLNSGYMDFKIEFPSIDEGMIFKMMI